MGISMQNQILVTSSAQLILAAAKCDKVCLAPITAHVFHPQQAVHALLFVRLDTPP
jgi:hypothetical protein